MIEGVKTKRLKAIPDERGRLMEILRADDDFFIRFGQVYLTTIYPGAVKAWHYHKKQIDHLTVIAGMAKLVLYDPRQDSSTCNQVMELFVGDYNPLLVQIPNMVYHGFKGMGLEETLILNCPTEVYHHDQPDEYRVDPYQNDIPYDWARKDG
ncbi:MAG: dTDP-4-dehydrorhamnose 3,5-epimerase family protein [bacterium]